MQHMRSRVFTLLGQIIVLLAACACALGSGTFVTKAALLSGLLLLFLLLCLRKDSARNCVYFGAAAWFLMMVYQYNFLDKTNDLFEGFQADSQWLVIHGINGVYQNKAAANASYGLFINDALTPYSSQVGLQGHLYRLASRLTKLFLSAERAEELLQLGCSLLMGVVACGIVWLLYKKYGKLLAGTFYAVFCLSPWVVNFARNLYWVEFTWFLPMLIGLVCVVYGHSRSMTAAAFAAIFLKCLCGYEYISSIMLGLILFPVVEWVVCLAGRDRAGARRWFWCVFRLGCAALAGFAAALCLHALLRGEGSLLTGLKIIYEQDVLRRTFGGDAAVLGEVYRESLEASIWQTVSRYFDFGVYFSTQVILGIDGNLFTPMVLCAAAAALWLRKEADGVRNLALYLFSAMIPLSWMVLAKAHSYVHVHMNFVLWYMGFVPVCLYLIAKAVVHGLRQYEAAQTGETAGVCK